MKYVFIYGIMCNDWINQSLLKGRQIMNKLSIMMKNCYGIHFLDTFNFDFNPKCNKAYAIYSPNGMMKTSFARSFDDIARGGTPKEERYNRPSECSIKSDNNPIEKEVIYVLKSEIDLNSETQAMTNILVSPDKKARYDELLIEIENLKNKLISKLQKASKVRKADVEKTILDDFNQVSFPECIEESLNSQSDQDLNFLEYATIFSSDATQVLKSQEFILKANEFNDRYQQLFDSDGTIYKKGIFNPTKAEVSFKTLKKQGFFLGGHRVHLQGDQLSVDEDELDRRQKALMEKIDGDEVLQKLRTSLTKNTDTQALIDLFEKLSYDQINFLLENLKPANQLKLRKDIWIYYIQNCPEAEVYIKTYNDNERELHDIEYEAAQEVPNWTNAVNLFNDRFVDMPFTLSIPNQVEAVLGQQKAELRFIFTEGEDSVVWSRSELKTLSQGEKRAVYLLNLIFEVESRKLNHQETLFVMDDIADSFDYKNKSAIVQYLQDLTYTPYFHQIILTHNFDFFRTLANTFVPYDRCLSTSQDDTAIRFEKAEGVKNYFIGKWKNRVHEDNCILCASIPFTRNLIEYTKGEDDPDYLRLTSLVHWKEDTREITIGDYLDIYNRLFGTEYTTQNNNKKVINLLFEKADDICRRCRLLGLELENKVLLCIAIRIQAEIFITNEIRECKGTPEFWSTCQYGPLLKEYMAIKQTSAAIKTLEKVSVTVSSNIHLNSFMYEPILDLTIEHLVALYREVKGLNDDRVTTNQNIIA